MSQNRTILTIVLLGLISLATARVDTAWVKTYNGPGNGTDYAYAIAVDGTGNVYVTGKSRGSSTNDDYATIKYGADGSEKWVSRYNGPGNVIDEAWAIAVDGAGNVYVTGRSTGSGTGYDYATIKYNPEGDTLWVKRYNGSGNSIDEAWEIAVDGAGNVYVTGRSRGANDDYATIKYNSAGDTVWVRTYNGPGNGADKANAIAVDGAGNVYVTGQSRGTNDDYATIKYNSAGDTLWVRRYNGPGNGDDNATAIAVDGAGNVYVTGYSIGTGGDYATIKYNSAGDTLWVRRYNGPGNGDDWAYAIAVDGAGNVYVTGNSYGTGYDYATIKYNPAGDTVWVKRYNGPGNSADEAKAIAVDGAGNVYVTGKSAGSGTSNDYATIKYNPAGDTLWVKRYNGPGNGSDVAYAIAVDGTGNVYVTGGCTGTGTGLDYATIKYVAPVLVSDVGCTKIEAPTGIIDLGTVITPACSVYNYGSTTESYQVRMKIGTTYNQTASVSGHAPGTLVYVFFPNWTALTRGSNAVSCSTELTGDVNPGNDKQSGSVFVQVRDVGVTRIEAPTGIIDSGTVITPACSVYNYGNQIETYQARMKIGDFYNENTLVSNHTPGTFQYVQFPNWTAIQRGISVVSCSTELTGDIDNNNDRMFVSVTVRVFDVGCTKIEAPTGIIDSGTVITPACSVYNYGDQTASYIVRMKIADFYNETQTIPAHAPDTYEYLTFPDWLAAQIGTHAVSCSTELISDINSSNDKQADSVEVQRPTTQPGWQRMANIPTEPSGKNPKSGSCMAGLGDKIYYLKASNRQDFAVYDPVANAWTKLETIPKGIKEDGDGKKPKKGASMTTYDSAVYVLRGSNTLGFWKYVAIGDSTGWKKLANIPEGTKKSKDASGMTKVNKDDNDYLFVMKGSKTDEFYLYDLAQDSWIKVSSPPIGESRKKGYKKGSCLACDGEFVYVLQGNHGSFFRYKVAADSWLELRQYSHKIFLNRDGKKKKPKDGAALVHYNNNVYMLKGGKTNEVWMYSIAADSWSQMNENWDIPLGTNNRKVKGGGSLIMFGDNPKDPTLGGFFVSKGANTDEFYRHELPTYQITRLPRYQVTNILNYQVTRLLKDEFALKIAPNPAINVTAVRYTLPRPGPVNIKLYDITGAMVKSYNNSNPTKDGVFFIDAKALPSGVYILHFNAGDIRITRKLVIER